MTSCNDSGENLAAVVRKKTGILKFLLRRVQYSSGNVRKKAASALWNLSYDERSRDEIAALGGVPALVSLANSCRINSPPGIQVIAVGVLMQLSTSERNSIAIGQEGGVTPLIALAKSDADVEVRAAATGALWNLASIAENAMRIIEADGVPTLVHICSSPGLKLVRFMSAIALMHMFDKRLDELARTGTSSGSTSKSSGLIRARSMAQEAIKVFLESCSDPGAISEATASLIPSLAALKRVTESAQIDDADALECSGSDIDRLSAMLSHDSDIIKSICAFALFQFTLPGGEYALNSANLLEKADARRKIRRTAYSVGNPTEAKAFARVALRNLERHLIDHSI